MYCQELFYNARKESAPEKTRSLTDINCFRYCRGPFYGQDQKKNPAKQLGIAYLLFEAEHTAEQPARISTKIGQARLVRNGVVA